MGNANGHSNSIHHVLLSGLLPEEIKSRINVGGGQVMNKSVGEEWQR